MLKTKLQCASGVQLWFWSPLLIIGGVGVERGVVEAREGLNLQRAVDTI